MSPRTITDPSGRVIITEHDDRDTPFALIVGQVINVRGISAFSELVRLPMERARRGHLLLSGNVQTTAAFTGQYVAMELNVVGYVGASPTTLLYTAMDSNLNLAQFTWDEPETYGAIGIEARQLVDGLPSGTATGIAQLTFTLSGFYWR